MKQFLNWIKKFFLGVNIKYQCSFCGILTYGHTYDDWNKKWIIRQRIARACKNCGLEMSFPKRD